MYRMIPMEPAEDGMWNARVAEDLKGKFYAFNAKIDEVWQGDTPGLMARAVGVNGNRAAILDLRTTDPEGWANDRRPVLNHFSDIVIYELHHRDFSIDTVSGIRHRGKYLALTEDSTHTYWGDKTGISHLKELGITHVHLLPSFDFRRWMNRNLTSRSITGGMTRRTIRYPRARMRQTRLLPKSVSGNSSRWSWLCTKPASG